MLYIIFVLKLLHPVQSYKVMLTIFLLCTPKEKAIKGLHMNAAMVAKQIFRDIHELWKHTFSLVYF